jgi:hypothetical protein
MLSASTHNWEFGIEDAIATERGRHSPSQRRKGAEKAYSNLYHWTIGIPPALPPTPYPLPLTFHLPSLESNPLGSIILPDPSKLSSDTAH